MRLNEMHIFSDVQLLFVHHIFYLENMESIYTEYINCHFNPMLVNTIRNVKCCGDMSKQIKLIKNVAEHNMLYNVIVLHRYLLCLVLKHFCC